MKETEKKANEPVQTVVPDIETTDRAIARAREFLLNRQHPQGYWVGFLENDSSCTGLYVLLTHYLDRKEPARIRKAIRYLIRSRNAEGGWVQYPGGGSHLDTTLISYIALVLAGVPEEDPEMDKSRNLIMELGGLEETNFITRILLAFFGIFPFESLPWVTARLIDNTGLIYRQGFPRTILIPYLVLFELKAVKDVSHQVPMAAALWGSPKKGLTEEVLQTFMGGFNILHDPVTSVFHQEKCLGWIAEHQEADGTWAGVLQVTLFSLMALHADRDERWEEAIQKGLQGVHSYQVETTEETIQQFSVSPVMDTAYAVRALHLAGLEGDATPLQTAVQWLLTKQSLREGDWKHNNPEGEPGGWGFEFHNTWYPDLDCTSMVLNALACLEEEIREPYYEQLDRGIAWVLSMQNWDGGFAVWDKNNWVFLKVMNNLVVDVGDYSHADITARVLIALAGLLKLPRYRERSDLKKAIRSAGRFLWGRQEKFQRWYGRWNVNYTYATGQVLEAMAEKGVPASHLLIRPALGWLARVQNTDGGWGESLESYEKHQFVPAPSTAMQSACVLQGLIRIGAPQHEAVHQGVAYLLASQQPDGHWEDLAFLAVNIPRVWYGRYELVSTYFALIALCEYEARMLCR